MVKEQTFVERAARALGMFGQLMPADGRQLIRDLCAEADYQRKAMQEMAKQIATLKGEKK